MNARRERTVQAKAGGHLLVEELGRELVVYDRHAHTAHVLDPRAAVLWRACVRRLPVTDLLPLVEAESDEQRQALLQLALTDLERAGLVTLTGPAPNDLPRRALLRRLGAVAALPLVVSILAPTPAAAASCVTFNTACGVPPMCCSGTQNAGAGPGKCSNGTANCNLVCSGGICLGGPNCCCSNDSECASNNCQVGVPGPCACVPAAGKSCA